MCYVYGLLGFLVLCGTLWCYATGGRRDHPQWAIFQRFRYAHRGLHGEGIPENSMAAFERAYEAGYGVELDVHLTGDGNLAVIHDKSLLRTAGVDVAVSALSVRELKRYTLEGTEERIPLLEEVLELFQNGPPLLVELKADYYDTSELVARAVETLDRYRVRYCVESFHPGVIRWLRCHRPDICRGQLSRNFWRDRGELKGWQSFIMTNLLSNFLTRPDFISIQTASRTLPSVRMCRRLHHLALFCWTVRSQAEMEQVEKDGAMVIFEGFTPTPQKTT